MVLIAVRKIRLIDWIIQIFGKVMLEAFMRTEMEKRDICRGSRQGNTDSSQDIIYSNQDKRDSCQDEDGSD